MLEAGADILVTSSYQGTIPGFISKGLSAEEGKLLLEKSVKLAIEARDSFWDSVKCILGHNYNRALVAASIGSYGVYLADDSEYRLALLLVVRILAHELEKIAFVDTGFNDGFKTVKRVSFCSSGHVSTCMDRRTFAILCHFLRTVAGLSSTKIVDVEEMVAMFLHVLAHDVKTA
ncbi:homocysteine S-methyltransferase 1 [Cucumis melo var. makuwa]|uniref:Homocysteine S-methyltransferase 1 n=1 Tax=Cucumis melo var. makuwa TaxID=1194695 RepID=A0A5A7TLL6_CUCMM|nr:homocysteine S-methyltransferase 1 [Cucumis melo var. makuwa]TYK22905.1 homocysteine S-methyltransferase 1 [Cucumis melo var. makuwa]